MAPSTPHKPVNTEWDTPKRSQVLLLSQKLHMKPFQIKKITEIPTPTIHRIIASNQPRRNQNPRSGRPKRLSPRNIRHLVKTVTQSQDARQASYMQIARGLGMTASLDTIRCGLRKAGFRRCVACPKPLVSWINRRKRLKWAREHLHWTKEDWKRVMFTDESSFETGQRARTFVTRRPGEGHCPDCMVKFKHSSWKSVMVWRGIMGSQSSDLVEVKKTIKKNRRGVMKESITTTDYINQILSPHLEPWYWSLEAANLQSIFMQDEASIHVSAEARLWLQQHQIETLVWPSSSPDLNPDEYMWRSMKQKIKRYEKLNFDEKTMFKAVKDEWAILKDNIAWNGWVESMPERCQTVIRNHGFATEY